MTTKKLFDPFEMTRKVEKVVTKGNRRRYTGFGTTPDYRTGVATGYAAGCNIRCVYCWANESRDKPEIAKVFYSPQEVFDRLYDIVKANPPIDKMRISGGEPTLGKEHLLEVIELCEKSDCKMFVLETNGILLGQDNDLLKELKKFKKLYVRLALKAGTPESFSRITGVIPEAFDYPFEAIKRLRETNIYFSVASMCGDPRFMTPYERVSLLTKLGQIDPNLVLNLEEETVFLYPSTMKRLNQQNWEINEMKIPFFFRGPLRKYVQITYYKTNRLSRYHVNIRQTLKNFIQINHGI